MGASYLLVSWRVMMLAFLKRSPKGLKQSRRAMAKLANAVRRLDRQRDTHGILHRLRPLLGDMHRELDAYETRVSEGEDPRTAASGFHSKLNLLATDIRQAERELWAARGLSHRSQSPLGPLYGPLDNLKTVSKQLNGPETDFQRELNELIRKSGVTPYALAAFHNSDPSFIYKLMNGERRKPARDSFTRIATALMGCSAKISEKDVNRLLHSAGYPPLRR